MENCSVKKSSALFAIPAILAVSFSANATIKTEWVGYNKVGDDLTQIDGHNFLQYRDAGFAHAAAFGNDTYDWQISCSSPCTTTPADWELQTSGLLPSEYRRSTTPAGGTVSYQYGGDTVGWEQWLYSGKGLTASAKFDVASTAVTFLMVGDYNDGPANYLVDGVHVTTENLRFGTTGADGVQWKALIVSGLDYGMHSIGIEFASDTTDFLDEQHIAFFGGAAIDVPEPGTMALFSTALIGVAAVRKKKVK